MRPPNPNGTTKIQRCEHINRRVDENFTDVNVMFCQDCGTTIITEWNKETQDIEKTTYISPFESYELLGFARQTLDVEVHVDGEWVDESALDVLKDKIREWMTT